ncbi:tripartite tricarboxylate transporter substrate binding protein [Bordetella sp. BOR01]|uniref:tripartite tricarboxylate transporter substrate binding protein n=1 Tax=Bordetella sp. BOR01 TaxID=2854779 RepID=UPI001C44A70C|nr:tripartite tricarboxylate transporter substrate binding protein [Bordetella sp. BOR01]MBV7484748.1 tripartite tricarboxylate transporter substrate binding protein [Bordetella sp. BOR01]
MTHIKKMPLSRLAASLALAAGLAGAGPVLAAYPEHPINLVASYGPGGGTDLVARMMAPFLQKYLGGDARIVVLNRPGAGGAIGFAEIANAKPDGYTIGFINTPNLLTIPIERKTSFTWKSYDLLGNLIDDPGGFTVHRDSGIRTLDELAAYAKANPGKVTVGTTGTGSDDHIAMLQFQRASGTTLTHVPYKGAGEVRGAMASQQIVVGAINVGEALQYIKGGTPLRFLGQMSKARSDLAPDVPTFIEQGYAVQQASLRGLAAPKGLPAEVRDKLVQAVAQTVQDPAFKKQAAALYAPLRYLAPADYAAELAESEAGYQSLWKELPWVDK